MVILDNGHGNNTPGKRSPVWPDGSQLFEYEFTRDIVKRIHDSLTYFDIESIILVPEEIDIPLIERCKRANLLSKNYPESFLLSIHGNAGDKPNIGTGWEVWTSPGQTKSDEIATILFETAKLNLPDWKMRSDISDGDPDKESKFSILIDTVCPAVLTENLFYDNEKDCRFMMSDEGRKIIAKLHVESIIKYLKNPLIHFIMTAADEKKTRQIFADIIAPLIIQQSSDIKQTNIALLGIESHLGKLNGTVASQQRAIEALKLADVQHIVDCPAMPKIETTKTDLEKKIDDVKKDSGNKYLF